MIDTDTPRSPGWWLKILMGELHNRRCGRAGARRWNQTQIESRVIRPPLDLLAAYRRGDPPLRKDIHEGWADPFRRFVRMGRLNVADLMVSPTSNRMGIRDFKTAAARDELGDAEARRIVKRNKLKLVSRDVHDYMLALGDGYTMVTPPDSYRDKSLITAESPLFTITAHDPATGRTLAGLKMVRDDYDNRDFAYLFLPFDPEADFRQDGKYLATREGNAILGRDTPFRWSGSWEWVPEQFDDVPEGRVPIIRFRNRGGVGEFEPHLDHLDRINDKVFNEWWIGKINGFRQRAVKNLPDEDSKGNVIDYSGMFTSSPDALWQLPADSDIWESSVVDVNPLVNSIQKELQWLASAASKPLKTLAPDAANQSAAGADSEKDEHLYTVEDRRDRAEDGWAETMSMAFLFDGDRERADATQIEVIWGPMERFSLQEKADAASKAVTSLPFEAIATDIWQYPPATVPELRNGRGRDLLFQAPGQPPAPAPAPAPMPVPAPVPDQPQG